VVRGTILTAIIAGLIAALVFTLVQSIWMTPLILQGETYEATADAGADASNSDASGAEHHHNESGWKPQDGLERTVFTFAANLLMGVGYAFVLVALYLLWRAPRSALWGAAYGIAGFAVFFAAPGLGLPPELPGTAAADLTVRQEWWLLTAAATAVGFIVLFSALKWWAWILALAVIVAPHLIAAPHPVVAASAAPAELQGRFRLASTLCNSLFWLSLGVASSVLFRKLVSVKDDSRGRTDAARMR
jgi:cobalt transporter subunit CbtA